jgi:hypothetical protein
MTKYRWVWHPDREHNNRELLYDVGILPDGTLHNPNNYPDETVRAAVLAADADRHERRSKAASNAAVTRARRREKRIDVIARQQVLEPATHCRICRRALTDPASQARGIGPECWDGYLRFLERRKDEAAADQPGLHL